MKINLTNKSVSSHNKTIMYICGAASHERSLCLNGINYILYWTPHAKQRAEHRENSSTIILGTFLADVLKDVASRNLSLLHEGYVCIRDFKTRLFAIIHINHNEHKIRVVTCGDVNGIYPRRNDYVINRHVNNNIQSFYWSAV